MTEWCGTSLRALQPSLIPVSYLEKIYAPPASLLFSDIALTSKIPSAVKTNNTVF